MVSSRNNNSLLKIINGQILDPDSPEVIKKNILIEDGIIKEISLDNFTKDCEVLDANGLYVTAGFIDMHAHLREPGFEQKENIETGCKSAVAGGFTSILAMPNTRPVNDNPDTTKYIIDRAKKIGLLDVFPVGAMTKNLDGKEEYDYSEIISMGSVAISDDGKCIQDEAINERVFRLANEKNILLISHPEIFSLNNSGCINEGVISKKLNLRGIPEDAENKAIERDIRIASKIGARLHIAHVSTKKGVELVREAKKLGHKVTAEVTPHHILLTEDDIEIIGTNAKMNPPLRTNEDKEALIDGINDGTIDVIATDHAPHEISSKNVGFEKASFGITGFETMLPVLLKLVHENKISLNKFIAMVTKNPAKILGLNGIGKIEVGKKANIAIWDKDSKIIIDIDKLYTKGKNTPFAGMTFKGKVHYTIYNGKVVYREHEEDNFK